MSLNTGYVVNIIRNPVFCDVADGTGYTGVLVNRPNFPTAITLHTDRVTSLAIAQMKDLCKKYSSMFGTNVIVH